MPKPPFMHGFILGDVSNISYKAQKMIEGMLSIDQHMMNNENMEGMTGKMKDNVMNADKENMIMNNGMQDMNENIKHDLYMTRIIYLNGGIWAIEKLM
jgi:hypothetical protein